MYTTAFTRIDNTMKIDDLKEIELLNKQNIIVRCAGRSTRIVDNLVQELFTKGYCVCRDHDEDEIAHKNIYERTLKRVLAEHRVVGLVFDANLYIIALDKETLDKHRQKRLL